MSKSIYNTTPLDGGKKKQPEVVPYDMDKEMRELYNKNIQFDNKPAIQIARSAATKAGISPSLLFSSAYQEGMNKAISKPDEVSEAFVIAEGKGLDTKTYPVDGFYNYGLDTFGQRYEQLKKYLPKGFEEKFKTYDALNEKNEKIKTAAFKTNEDALIAKAAMLRQMADYLQSYAKKKNITINPEDMDYFILSSYNSGPGNAKTMMDEYAKAKDKKAFIEQGLTSRKGVHKNVFPRLKRMKLAQELLDSLGPEVAQNLEIDQKTD